MKRSQKKIILLIALLLFLTCLIRGAVYLKSVADYKRAVKEITFDDVNISDIPDGVYIGDCDVNFIYAKVKVIVQNGNITDINLWNTDTSAAGPQKPSLAK